jgi:hypothetical protein
VVYDFRLPFPIFDLEQGSDEMNRPYRRLTDLTSAELQRRAMSYRRMALGARGQDIASALDRLAIRFVLLAAQREVEEASHPSSLDAIHQNQSELNRLIKLAEQAAADEPDPVRALVEKIRAVAEGNADPYLVMGVLVEGAVRMLETRIPAERRGDTARALLQLVADRLELSGMLNEN